MKSSCYLDHLRRKSSYFYDEGYDSHQDFTTHHSFHREISRESDLALPEHPCGNPKLGKLVLFDYYQKDPKTYSNAEDSENATVEFCERCGWWRLTHEVYYEIDQGHDKYGSATEIFTGAQKVFPRTDEDQAIVEVSKLLHGEHTDLQCLNPRLFEKALASVFRNYYNVDVKHIGGPNDSGVDLLCVSGESTFLIQIKRRANGKAESVATVRDLIGAYVLYSPEIGTSSHSAHIITTAPRFSEHAVRTSRHESLRKLNFSINLHDYDAVKEIFGFASGSVKSPWDYVPIKYRFKNG